MNRSLLILGCGGHGRVVADAALECGYGDIAFLDDANPAKYPAGARVLGPFSMLGGLAGEWPAAIAAVGACHIRRQLFASLQRLSFLTPSIVHPAAVISRGAHLGEGVFVAAGAVVNTGARIGDAAIVNTGARIDHDCSIGPGTHIAPGATLSGNVTVGENAWLGTGCAVRQGITIGDEVTVGVGAAVISDLAAGHAYVGVPARDLKKHDGH